MRHALVVDDDGGAAETLAMLIADEGCSVACAGTLRDARRQLAMRRPEVLDKGKRAAVKQLQGSRSGSEALRTPMLLGQSPGMQRVLDQIERVALTGVTVLVTGESGTGKELVAATVHDRSRRRDMPLL